MQANAPIVILGGSAEARALAASLGARAHLWLPARDRVTGASASGLADFADPLEGAGALIAAPHPCDVATLSLAAHLSRSMDVPHLNLIRPAWRAGRRDRWIAVRDVRDAAAQIPPGARVLVTLGRPALSELAALRHAHALVRQLTRHRSTFPLRHGRFLHGTPPFTVTSEVALMRRNRIDAVLTRNAGGSGGWPKIAAARTLGIPVYMVARPKPLGGAIVHSVEDALYWLERRVWSDV
ncbi:precorrin-6A/cobalt-precorrin-6A reductase [Marivita sp. S6314]|uniref:precorrin-6A/cobalt-precorrin-6A reductase n=1 Tax=Marivita sp. S6314 TaxID=2926406 RepID=UPI001FF62C89|nr:precorrin-6A/cobalt-precorrin-6A reductase [Marivita sp. S6314]